MKILVLAGGYSNERNVSLASGVMSARALRERGHRVVLTDLFLGEEDGLGFDALSARPLPEEWFTIAAQAADLEAVRKARGYASPALIGRNVLELCRAADIVFLALHGGAGEDGRLQAALELFGIPYTGSGYLASALAMNKDLAKILAADAGVRIPAWQRVLVRDEEHVAALMRTLPLPCVVKLPDSGSSVGVYIAKTEAELRGALEAMRGRSVLIEQFIAGREIQMASLRGAPLPSIEIVPLDPFYTYASKYSKGAAVETTPAAITPDQERLMGAALMKVVRALGIYSYSRADFIIDGAGDIWFIEINTLPGLTPTSLVPQEAAAAGIDFGELCEMLVQDGLQRFSGLSE